MEKVGEGDGLAEQTLTSVQPISNYSSQPLGSVPYAVGWTSISFMSTCVVHKKSSKDWKQIKRHVTYPFPHRGDTLPRYSTPARET